VRSDDWAVSDLSGAGGEPPRSDSAMRGGYDANPANKRTASAASYVGEDLAILDFEIKIGQEWSVHSDRENRWRPVRVVIVLADEVEVQYLDVPDQPDHTRTQKLSRARMLSEPGRFRLDKDVI
jgi:hypothetical protein